MRYWIIPVDGPRLTDRHDLLGPYNTSDLAGYLCDRYRAAGVSCDVAQSATRPVLISFSPNTTDKEEKGEVR